MQGRNIAAPTGGERTSSQPLRVLLFDHTAQLGGGEIALADMVRSFDRSKVTPIVLLASDGPLTDRLRGSCELHVLPLSPAVLQIKKDSLSLGSLRQVRNLWQIVRYVPRLVGFLREHRIELLHTNSLKADILGGIAGRIAGVPVIWHIRDRIAEDYLPRPVVRTMRLLARRIPAYVLANSAATLATVQLEGRVPSSSVSSGVDLSAFAPGALDSAEGPAADPALFREPGTVRIGLVGRICPWKGQHIFLAAAAEVHARFPQTRFQIIGAALFNELAYEAEMHALAGSLGIGEVVQFLGFRKDVPQLLHALDILVHASTTGEPFGQVIVQGMAAGKPVVATNGGGVPEIVVQGETGILVPMGDAPRMAEAIVSLILDPALAKAMGERGHQRVLDHFTLESTARTVERIYATIASHGRRSRNR